MPETRSYTARMSMQLEEIRVPLRTLGAILQDRGTPFELLIVGGGDLLLLGLIDRATADVDVIGVKDGSHYQQATELPEPLLNAAADVSDTLGIPAKWINSGPASLMEFGLPLGLGGAYRSPHVWRARDPPDVLFRSDLLQALRGHRPRTRRQALPRSGAVGPTKQELLTAAAWARSHDPSEGFRTMLIGCLDRFGVEADDVAS